MFEEMKEELRDILDVPEGEALLPELAKTWLVQQSLEEVFWQSMYCSPSSFERQDFCKHAGLLSCFFYFPF